LLIIFYYNREGFIESRIRKLIGELERTVYVQYAVPISESYKEPNGPEFNTNFFLGIVTDKNADAATQATAKPTIDLSIAVTNFTCAVKTAKFFNHETMEINITHVSRRGIPDFCFPDGRPKRRRKRRREVKTTEENPAKKQKVDGENEVSAEEQPNVENGETTSEVDNVPEEIVEIPEVPELNEIGGNDEWTRQDEQRITKKPKVTLMSRMG